MKWRVVKRVYSDDKEWYYLQQRNWIGQWKEIDRSYPLISSEVALWLGFATLEDAIKECDKRNNVITEKSLIVVYPV